MSGGFGIVCSSIPRAFHKRLPKHAVIGRVDYGRGRLEGTGIPSALTCAYLEQAFLVHVGREHSISQVNPRPVLVNIRDDGDYVRVRLYSDNYHYHSGGLLTLNTHLFPNRSSKQALLTMDSKFAYACPHFNYVYSPS